MSNASFPAGMRTYPSSGYVFRAHFQHMPYVTWKPHHPLVGLASGHVRPTQEFTHVFGKANPIRHYRLGRAFSSDQQVRSHRGASLGGGAGGTGLIQQWMDRPGSINVLTNTKTGDNGNNEDNGDNGEENENQGRLPGMVSYMPISTDCCKLPQQATRRVRYPSFVQQGYCTSSQQYLRSRCKRYEDNTFHYPRSSIQEEEENTGSSLFRSKQNCSKRVEGEQGKCEYTSVYKPSNYKFATQGAVSSSLRTIQKVAETLSQRSQNTIQEKSWSSSSCSTSPNPLKALATLRGYSTICDKK